MDHGFTSIPCDLADLEGRTLYSHREVDKRLFNEWYPQANVWLRTGPKLSQSEPDPEFAALSCVAFDSRLYLVHKPPDCLRVTQCMDVSAASFFSDRFHENRTAMPPIPQEP